MPIPASLIASIVSAIIETAVEGNVTNTAIDTATYETYTINRTLPPEAMLGSMLPLQGDGFVVINGKPLPLSPAAQFRNQRNLIVMPMTIQDKKDIIYISNASGAVHRVWMVTPAEIAALKKTE